MKNIKFITGILLIMFVIGIILTGCEDEPEKTEPEVTKYTVYTFTLTYSEYSQKFPALTDGNYGRMEITNSEFNSFPLGHPDQNKHNWTEDQIYNWFIGIGFSNSLANQQKAYLITNNHCFIAIRDVNTVYTLLK